MIVAAGEKKRVVGTPREKGYRIFMAAQAKKNGKTLGEERLEVSV